MKAANAARIRRQLRGEALLQLICLLSCFLTSAGVASSHAEGLSCGPHNRFEIGQLYWNEEKKLFLFSPASTNEGSPIKLDRIDASLAKTLHQKPESRFQVLLVNKEKGNTAQRNPSEVLVLHPLSAGDPVVVDNEVQKALSKGQLRLSIRVVLKAQLDVALTRQLLGDVPASTSSQEIIRRLKEVSKLTQDALTDQFTERDRRSLKSLWLTNSFTGVLDPSTIRRLAETRCIESIKLNRPQYVL